MYNYFLALRYGQYDHPKREHKSPYEDVWSESVGFAYSTRVKAAILGEMTACRKDVAMFDCSAAGKVRKAPGFATNLRPIYKLATNSRTMQPN